MVGLRAFLISQPVLLVVVSFDKNRSDGACLAEGSHLRKLDLAPGPWTIEGDNLNLGGQLLNSV